MLWVGGLHLIIEAGLGCTLTTKNTEGNVYIAVVVI